MKKKPFVIALYLPQYHPFKENNEWWGEGFTEWTSVGKAKPMFKGHYQPHVPADLGYYDLRLPIVREQQVRLAKEAGVNAFCYWHYWFGNGKQLMESIFNDVLASGKPDFPFCLGWANHSWFAKNWNVRDTKGKDKLLIEQRYLDEEDYRMHYEYALKAFKDNRYVKVGNKPFFMIFKPKDVPQKFYQLWEKWAKDDGFDGIFFVGNAGVNEPLQTYRDLGLCSVIRKRTTAPIDLRNQRDKFWLLRTKIIQNIFAKPAWCLPYKEAMKDFVASDDADEYIIPNLIPNFDHSPRSGQFGIIYDKSTPELFYKHARQSLAMLRGKNNNIVMLRSWNEWGEGNYMEPDLKFGKGYIKALRNAIDDYMNKD